MTPSGTPSRPASSATAPTVPSPPATTRRSGAAAGERARGPRLAAEHGHLRPVLAHGAHERLGIEPPPEARLAISATRTRQPSDGAVVARRPDACRALPPCSRGSTTSASPSPTSTRRIALHEPTYGMPLVHRETSTSQGVEAVLLDVGENHVELLRAAGRRHAGRPVPGQARPRAAPRRLPGRRTSRRRCAQLRGAGRAADRRGAADRHPRLARRVPAPRRRAARCSPSSSSPLRFTHDRRDERRSASRAGRCSPCGSPRTT